MRYLVQYRGTDGHWRTYSRHNKPEKADETLRKLKEFYRPMRFPAPVRIIRSFSA